MGIKSKLDKIWDRPSILREAEDINPEGDPPPLTPKRTQPGAEILGGEEEETPQSARPLADLPLDLDNPTAEPEPEPEPEHLELEPEPVTEPALAPDEFTTDVNEQAPAQMTREDVHEIISNYNEQLNAIFNKDSQASILRKLGAVIGQIKDENRRNVIQDSLNQIAEHGTEFTKILANLREAIVQGLGIVPPEAAPEAATEVDFTPKPKQELLAASLRRRKPLV
jgi:hypothetical protein